jgi:hypothetical protein
MESDYVFQTLQARLSGSAIAAILCVVSFAAAVATTLVPSQTLKAGTKINCVLDESFNSTNAKYGDKFKLRVVDPSQPALQGSHITGWITEVDQPSGLNKAKVVFFLTTIHLANGSKKPISAYVVSKRVTPYNPMAAQASRQQLAAPMPNGFVTPGPIAWQAKIGSSGPVQISNRPTGTVGGTIYAANTHEPIVVPAGQPVTIELQQNLTIP